MAERDTTDLPDEEPTPAWLADALDAPVPTDELTRERHLRAALRAFDELTFEESAADEPVPPPNIRRGRRTPRWLAAAAAIVVAVGVGGIWLVDGSSSNDSAEQVAGRESSADRSTDASSPEPAEAESELDDSTQTKSANDGGAAGQGGATDDALKGQIVDPSSASTLEPAIDLGAFGSDDELRRAIRANTPATTTAPVPPATAPPATFRSMICAIPPFVAPSDPTTPRPSTYVATVAGTPVEVWVTGTGDTSSIIVIDAVTCTVRPG